MFDYLNIIVTLCVIALVFYILTHLDSEGACLLLLLGAIAAIIFFQ